MVRLNIEVWLGTATDSQRIAVDEFIGVLEGNGDSGSVYSTVQVLIDFQSKNYIQEVLNNLTKEGVS